MPLAAADDPVHHRICLRPGNLCSWLLPKTHSLERGVVAFHALQRESDRPGLGLAFR
jgi:hypothetical protein